MQTFRDDTLDQRHDRANSLPETSWLKETAVPKNVSDKTNQVPFSNDLDVSSYRNAYKESASPLQNASPEDKEKQKKIVVSLEAETFELFNAVNIKRDQLSKEFI